eukprot:TRINITY_DN9493_c0_g1_i2.p1 TRINITY_DN9493_c0_g1~~TRINITY_DN9493_c0_g1_i2.p1  ORF type:complete len:1298 (-),score=490.68 TRINITY_DN9493_c0_g1_i2:114-4007(-)
MGSLNIKEWFAIMEVDDEVIEIESDDEEEEVDEQEQQKADNTSGKAVFSALFCQSSHESDEELEVSNVDDIKSKVAAADGPNDEADDLVIVEDSSNSTEVPAPAAETGSVLFSTFGKVTADDLVVEEFSTVEEKSQVKETNVEESRVKESEPHANVDELLEGSEESEPEVSFEEDPVYYEEQEPFDLEADFYSPGAQAKKAAVSKSHTSTYSYDVCTSEVDSDRKPTERKEESEKASTSGETDSMDLVRKIMSEAKSNEEVDLVTKEVLPEEEPVSEKEEVVIEDNSEETEPKVKDENPELETELLLPEGHEDDDMRELLDHVSTTATRASSIAGSIFGENRAGSVSGSIFGDAPLGYGPTFSFSEPGHLDQSEDQESEEQSRLNFNFSMPLDSSQMEEDENKIPSRVLGKSKLASEPSEEVYDKLELRNRTVTEKFSLLSDIGMSSKDEMESEEDQEEQDESSEGVEEQEEQDESGEGDEDKEEDDEESRDDDSSDESEEDGPAGGLEFSWTKIPSQSTANVSQIVSEEIRSEASNIFTPSKVPESPFLFGKPESGYLRELKQDAGNNSSAQLLFSEPLVESENQDVGLNDSQFEFGEPHDMSMEMEEDVEADVKFEGIAKIDKPLAAMATPVKTSKLVTPSRHSARKPSRDEDILTKAETLPHEFTPLKVVKSSRKTPAKNTPKKTPAKVAVLEFDSVEEESESTDNVTASGRPKRGRSTRASSVDVSFKAPSLASTEPIESDNEERIAQFATEEQDTVPVAPPSSTKKRGRPRKQVTTPVVDKSRTDSTQSKVSMMDISTKSTAISKASTVPMDTGSTSTDASAKLSKTTITSELDDLALAPKTTPATPIRRSRRISGVTPSLTPNIERSRRASGAPAGEMKPLLLGEKYDQLELRNRTVTETLSLVSDLGQEEEKTEPEGEKFDTLELRNRTVTETLSLTDNFGKGEKESKKPVTPTESNASIALRKSRRRSSNITPEGSPAATSAVQKSSPRGSKSSPLTASMSTSPKQSPVRSTRKAAKKEGTLPLESDITSPTTPVKASALPKHLTPLKKVLTPKKEDVLLTPTRRSRRMSSGDIGSGEPLTPSRRSRRLSGASESLDSAPDGGLITGGTPRTTPSTPRSRRHTSVRPEDVESALAIAGAAPLPTLVEEEEKEDSVEKEIEEEVVPVKKRGRKPAPKPSTPSLNIIAEEDTSGAEPSGLPDASTSDTSVFFPMKSRPKRKDTDQLTPEGPPKRRSRRVTITTLGTDVDLFTPVKGASESGSSGSRRESTGAAVSKKKYVPVKRKTSVRIK